MHWDDEPDGGGCLSWTSPGSGAASAATAVMPGYRPPPQERGPQSASAWFAPMRVRHHLRSSSPFQAPGLTVWSVLSFHGPDSKLQLDILKINIRLICELLRRGA